jgi:hypothetical protein
MDHFVIDLLKLQQKADYFMHIIVHENGTPVFEFTAPIWADAPTHCHCA